MLSSALFVLTFIAALGAALVAGIFYAFSTSVMWALGKLAPAQGIEAMQSINVAVFNGWFMGALFGTAALCLVLAIGSLFAWSQPGAVYILSGSVLYLAGTILVTIVFNVPLNEALAATKSAGTEGAQLWTRYLADWTWWNHLRTAAALAAAALLIMALVARAAA
jgi:uncharacterized membrane protein